MNSGSEPEHRTPLGEAIKAAPGFDMTRIRAALDGRFNADMLSPDEREIYEDLLGEALTTPSAKSVEFMKRLRREGGAVGHDDTGRYVRSRPGGDVEVIKDADDRAKG
jgi:hypothetical protein